MSILYPEACRFLREIDAGDDHKENKKVYKSIGGTTPKKRNLELKVELERTVGVVLMW